MSATRMMAVCFIQEKEGSEGMRKREGEGGEGGRTLDTVLGFGV